MIGHNDLMTSKPLSPKRQWLAEQNFQHWMRGQLEEVIAFPQCFPPGHEEICRKALAGDVDARAVLAARLAK